MLAKRIPKGKSIEHTKQYNRQQTQNPDLRIIPEASHLFDNNEGMIEEVAKITSE
jgi:hypothetical protein